MRTAWLVVALAGCGEPLVNDAPTYPPPLLLRVEPPVVLPTTALRLDATGLVAGARYELELDGSLDDTPFSRRVPADVLGPRTLSARWQPSSAGPSANLPATVPASFSGTARLVRYLDNQDIISDAIPLALTFVDTLTPTLISVSANTFHLGDTLVAEGQNLLHPSEGLVLARLSGTLHTGTDTLPVDTLTVPGFTLGQLAPDFTEAPFSDPATRLDRRRFGLVVTPDLFGIRPARFEGTLTLVNAQHDGLELASTPLPITLNLAPPLITRVAPEHPSRGMWLELHGRGFIHSDGLLQTATLVVAEGVFQPRRGAVIDFTGANAIHVFPEDLERGAFITVLRPDREDGLPLGAVAGRFVGRFTPLVLAGPDAVLGEGLDIELDVKSPHQVVQIRFLPGFDEALARFGLYAERDRIIARIFEVARRDYEGLNLSFVLEDPIAFSEYTIIEVGGPDPNDTGLFGLDNTAGKDVGNARFDDVIGGFNAETGDDDLAAYGGVFASEFMNLSPHLSDNPLATRRFDDIFADLAPELGGEPAIRGDSDGPRGPLIREAARVLGNLVGSTVTHEIGHALGLTALNGRYHNDGDTPNALMDVGVFRPFEERAELDGMGPAELEPFNRLYLESILPLDPP